MGVNQASDFHVNTYIMRLYLFIYSAMRYCLFMAQTDTHTLLDTIFVGICPIALRYLNNKD